MTGASETGDVGRLSDVLSNLDSPSHLYVKVPEMELDVLESLSPSEAELFSVLTEAAIPIGQFYDKYLNQYPGNWFQFGALVGDFPREISSVFDRASGVANQYDDTRYMSNYLSYIAYDWRHLINRFHPFSRSETEFLKNPAINQGKLVVRSSPGLEQYMQPGGYDPSLQVRIGEAVSTSSEMQDLQHVIYNYLGAAQLQSRVQLIYRKDFLGLTAGLHSSTPSGSQYVKEIDGVLYVVINSNVNIQKKANTELDTSVRKTLAPMSLAQNFNAIMNPEIEIVGHETSEVILETLYKKGLNKLDGRREAVELASTLSVLDALRIAKNAYGGSYVKLYEGGVWRIISRMILRRDSGSDSKMAVYSRGFDLTLRQLEEKGAFRYYDGKIEGINSGIFDDVVHHLNARLIQIISSGDKEASDKLFGLKKAA